LILFFKIRELLPPYKKSAEVIPFAPDLHRTKASQPTNNIDFLVEAAGIEPASENLPLELLRA